MSIKGFTSLFKVKKEKSIVGITVYLNKIEGVALQNGNAPAAPYVLLSIKETKSTQKSKTLKKGENNIKDVLFLKVNDVTDILRIEIYDKGILTSTLIATGNLQLTNVLQNEKREFIIDLSPSGKVFMDIEGFNFGKIPSSLPFSSNTVQETPQESPQAAKYLEVKKIGQGGMGSVYEALVIETKERVALKKIYCQSLNQLNSNMTEAMFAKGLIHPNLVKYLDVYITNTPEISPYTLCMTMELMTQGDMTSQLKRRVKKQDPIPKETILDWMKQITSAIEYLHEKKFVHRDLKPENFLMKDNQVKIADFGLMKDISAQFATTIAGTLNYMAPEVVSGSNKYDTSADMWSLGCCFYEMMVLKLERPLYIDMFMNQDFYKNVEEKILKNYSQDFAAIVTNLLQKEPEKRLNAKDLVKFLVGDLKLVSKDENTNVFNSELIQKVPFLKSSSKECIEDILKVLQPRVYLKDELIIKFGDEGNEMYFINKGVVSALSADKKQVFNVLSEGSFFGEFALLYPIKRTANIVVSSPFCDVFGLSKNDLTKIIDSYPQVGEELKKYGIGSLIRKLPLFKEVSKDALDEITVKMMPLSYKTTDIIVDGQQEGDLLYMVSNGVASSMNPEIGMFKLYQVGDTFGQECIKSGKYNQKVVALSGIDTFAIKFTDWQVLSEKFDFFKGFVTQEE